MRTNRQLTQNFRSPRNRPDKPLTPYEDRIIPTLRNSNKSRQEKVSVGDNIQHDEEQIISSIPSSNTNNNADPTFATKDLLTAQDQEFEQEMYDPMDGTEEMTEREVREAALMNDYLGKQIVSNVLLFIEFE